MFFPTAPRLHQGFATPGTASPGQECSQLQPDHANRVLRTMPQDRTPDRTYSFELLTSTDTPAYVKAIGIGLFELGPLLLVRPRSRSG
jgi:hypothetical protein